MTALLFIVTFAICLNVKQLFGSLVYELQRFESRCAPIVLVQRPYDLAPMTPYEMLL
jgi:hypothetical protein